MSPHARLFRPRTEILGINRRNLDHVFWNHRPGRFRHLDDKIISKELLAGDGVPIPRTYGVVRESSDLECVQEWLANLYDVVLKPSRGWGGRGILVLERSGTDWKRSDGRVVSLEELTNHVAEILAGTYSIDETPDAALLEERIRPDPFFVELFPRGLADLRIVLENGLPIQAMCRIPTEASDGKANLHEGGVGVGVDLSCGAMKGGVCRDRPVDRHPDSGLPFEGRVVPEWDRCLEIARSAARTAGVDYVGVDIVVDAHRGPMVLEINARPGLAIQIANREGQPGRLGSVPCAS